MALVKETLEAQILNIYESVSGNENTDPAEARKQMAKDLATAIDNYLKSAQVVGTSPSGAVTGNLV